MGDMADLYDFDFDEEERRPVSYAAAIREMVQEGPVSVEDVVAELGIQPKNASSVLRDMWKRGKLCRVIYRRRPTLAYLYAPDPTWLEPFGEP